MDPLRFGQMTLCLFEKTTSMTFITKKNLRINENLDKFIIKVFENGLIDRWNSEEKDPLKSQESVKLLALLFFVILGSGLSLALIAWIWEMKFAIWIWNSIKGCVKHLRNFFKITTYVSREEKYHHKE